MFLLFAFANRLLFTFCKLFSTDGIIFQTQYQMNVQKNQEKKKLFLFVKLIITFLFLGFTNSCNSLKKKKNFNHTFIKIIISPFDYEYLYNQTLIFLCNKGKNYCCK